MRGEMRDDDGQQRSLGWQQAPSRRGGPKGISCPVFCCTSLRLASSAVVCSWWTRPNLFVSSWRAQKFVHGWIDNELEFVR